MWENYFVNSSKPRTISISDTLRDSLDKYTIDKGCTIQDIFNNALITLWRIYNGQTESNKAKNPITESMVRNILNNNPMPKSKKKKTIAIAFRGKNTFEWVCSIEDLYMVHGTEDFIRRSLSYYMRKKGYLVDDIAAKNKKELEKELEIDTIE